MTNNETYYSNKQGNMFLIYRNNNKYQNKTIEYRLEY